MPYPKSVVVAGGGLAGCSAALALARHDVEVTLLESRKTLGGRAGSFEAPGLATAETSARPVDYCQHVGMGCCKNLRQLIDWLQQEASWDEQHVLHFYGPSGAYRRLAALPLLPAPLHLAGWLVGWPGLSLGDRISVASGLLRLSRVQLADELDEITATDWLQSAKQSPRAVSNFWRTIVVSALGEEIDSVSLAMMAKVIQVGFLQDREAFHLLVPRQPLSELFNHEMQTTLRHTGVNIELETPVNQIVRSGQRIEVHCKDASWNADALVLALPWFAIDRLTGPAGELDQLKSQAVQLQGSPITGIHTWWDRPWLDTAHASIVGRTCQWVFPRPADTATATAENRYYYQIVVSASGQLPRDKRQLSELIKDDLKDVFPKVHAARLLELLPVTNPRSVFSTPAGLGKFRPAVKLNGGIVPAGDWTDTGWPATMEGAIRSGFMAAARLLESWGIQHSLVID